jgi:hypothetical protein
MPAYERDRDVELPATFGLADPHGDAGGKCPSEICEDDPGPQPITPATPAGGLYPARGMRSP